MDFYYGYIEGTAQMLREYNADWSGTEFIGFALYFCNADIWISHAVGLTDDYHNIEGLWFIKEISPKEFTSDAYMVSLSKPYHKRSIFNNRSYIDITFNYCETLAIPKEALINKSGHLGFWIVGITHVNGEYFFSSETDSKIYIKYKYINKDTLSFSKPGKYEQKMPDYTEE